VAARFVKRVSSGKSGHGHWKSGARGPRQETYLLTPRDPADIDLLIKAIRPAPSPSDIDVVICVRGTVAQPDMCRTGRRSVALAPENEAARQ
jgi:hypothetical protein